MELSVIKLRKDYRAKRNMEAKYGNKQGNVGSYHKGEKNSEGTRLMLMSYITTQKIVCSHFVL